MCWELELQRLSIEYKMRRSTRTELWGYNTYKTGRKKLGVP